MSGAILPPNCMPSWYGQGQLRLYRVKIMIWDVARSSVADTYQYFRVKEWAAQGKMLWV
jgi:hypothetical protein